MSPETNSLGENSRVDTKPWTLSEPESIEEVRQNAIDDDLALVWHDSQTVRHSIKVH